ncbi:MAG: HyaD/HybD family hydrogenase maturation endopeptidase [Gammaproteobacteria bacterium]|nr:HyaD/HybD family hydrogenase maturation endopeptidase [Gammaproteobacteria bacterium]
MTAASAPHAQETHWDTLILGIGNVLWADEGFGVRTVETINARYVFPDSVRVMDGGTQGIFLLPWVRSASRLLIFDAIDFGLEPATLKLILGDDVPRYMGAKKVSMHQAGFQEVLSSAELSGEFPEELALVGVQPQLLDDYGGSLTEAVKAQIDPAIRLAREVLREWGVQLTERAEPLAATERIGPDALAIGDYESGRPLL